MFKILKIFTINKKIQKLKNSVLKKLNPKNLFVNFLIIFFLATGSRLATGNAGKINFWTVDVFAQVVPNAIGGSIFTSIVPVDDWRHSSTRAHQTKTWSPRTQEQLLEDTGVGYWNTPKNKNWEY